MRDFRLLSLLATLFAVGTLSAASEERSLPAPQPHYGAIAQKVVRAMPALHVTQRPPTVEVSRRAWTNLLDSFDFDRSYFLQSDIERFARHRDTFIAELAKGDVSLPFDVYRVFRERLADRFVFVTNALAGTFDFSVDESYRWKRKDQPWPRNAAEQNELWRKRVKNELLSLRLAKERDEAAAAASNKVAKAESGGQKAEGGGQKAEGGGQKAESGEPKAEDAPEEPVLTPEENIIEKYKQFLQVITDSDEEFVLQHGLGAFTMAYDPHSDYLSPMKKEDFDIDMSLSFFGIGATLRSTDGAAKIEELTPGGPAERDTRPCRLMKGDKIIGVGQGNEPVVSILHWPLSKAVRLIRGKKGTKVVLRVIPASDPSGSKTKLVDLIRDEVKLEAQAATGRVMRVSLDEKQTRKLGYVRLPTFYGTMDKAPDDPEFRSATADIAKYIAEFNGEGVSGLILDLRNNGGGSLREAIALVGLFLRSGPAVQVKEHSRVQVLDAWNGGAAAAFRKPVVVMINRASASASEIVAAALQDYGRAVVVGDTLSHGKGTVQTVLPLDRDEKYGSLKVTTACFYRINGASTQLRGVHSDIVIPSALDGLDWLGEDQLPGALPWSEIRPASYVQVADTAKFVSTLREKSAERLAQNEKYAKFARQVRATREMSARTEVPLEIYARRALNKTEDELAEIEDQIDSADANDEDKDVVLLETANILSDLVDLQGDGDLPLETDGDLRTRMMRIFGALGDEE